MRIHTASGPLSDMNASRDLPNESMNRFSLSDFSVGDFAFWILSSRFDKSENRINAEKSF